MYFSNRSYYPRRRGSLLGGLLIAVISLIIYSSSKEYNPITGENQHVAISPDQEIALGLQAAPSMAHEYGGLDTDEAKQELVRKVGRHVVSGSDARQTNWQFDFHLLADRKTVNAFALPGGQVFITRALLDLLQNEDQLASVLAHETGHVVARHSAEHIAKEQLTQGLTGATVVASGDNRTAQMAMVIGSLVNLKYSRNDELEADRLGVRLMREAGYNPEAMIDVMNILAKSSGQKRDIDFFSTHPNPENRIENIRQAIRSQQQNS
jgi:predicted Zn-dependent protease